MKARVRQFVFAALVTTGCGAPATDPEQAVRDLVQQAIVAAEKRSATALDDMVAADYRDGRGYDRRRIIALARVYLLRHQQIHLFARIREIEVIEPTQVRAVVVVAMAGRPIASADQLADLRADIVRFEVWFRRRDSAWLAVRADWEPASIADLL